MKRSIKFFALIYVPFVLAIAVVTSLGQGAVASQCKDSDYDCLNLEYGRFIADKCKGAGESCPIAQYTKMLEANPFDGAAYLGRGRAFWGREPDFAVQDLRKAIEINPGYYQTYISLGILYCAVKKDCEQAVIEFSKAIEVADQERRDAGSRRRSYLQNAYVNRGSAYLQKRDFDLALADYNCAIELYPSDSGFSGRTSVYAAQEEFDKAIADYTRAIELGPDNWLSYYVRGHLYLKQGDKSRGNADLKKSEELKKLEDNH